MANQSLFTLCTVERGWVGYTVIRQSETGNNTVRVSRMRARDEVYSVHRGLAIYADKRT